jgi:hypothetical protein
MSIVEDFRQTLAAVQSETAQRESISQTEEYQALQRIIENVQQEQQAMLSSVPDSREEHDMDKQELIRYMLENKLTQVEEFKAKTRAKRSVDTMAVLRALEGDMDSLMLVSSIKQKDLETFIRDNPLYRKDLRACIVDEGYTITDIVVS